MRERWRRVTYGVGGRERAHMAKCQVKQCSAMPNDFDPVTVHLAPGVSITVLLCLAHARAIRAQGRVSQEDLAEREHAQQERIERERANLRVGFAGGPRAKPLSGARGKD